MSKKFNILENGDLQKIQQHLIFCDANSKTVSIENQNTSNINNKTKPLKKISHCENSYKQIQQKVLTQNDNRLFSVATTKIIEMLGLIMESATIDELDLGKIKAIIVELKEEQIKHGGPIVEKQFIKEEAKAPTEMAPANFKVKIISNRVTNQPT